MTTTVTPIKKQPRQAVVQQHPATQSMPQTRYAQPAGDEEESPRESRPAQTAKSAVRRTPQGFLVPEVRHGQLVVFYPVGVKSTRCSLGVATEINASGTVTVRLLGSATIHQSIPHINDPRLARNLEMRKDGAWDFTDDEKERLAEMAAMRERMEDLERAVRRLGESPAPVPPAPAALPAGDPPAPSLDLTGVSGK